MNTKELENWTKNTLNSCIEKTNNDTPQASRDSNKLFH